MSKPKETQYREVTENHAAMVGKIAINWNALHGALGQIFADLLGKNNQILGHEIWSAIPNDRTARKVLVAAAKQVKGKDSRFFKDIEWVANNTPTLEDERDTALHSPYALTFKDEKFKFIPQATYGHTRAKKLLGKDLVAELTAYLDHTADMIEFVIGLSKFINGPDDSPSWPDRPRRRRVAHPQTHTKPRPKNTRK